MKLILSSKEVDGWNSKYNILNTFWINDMDTCLFFCGLVTTMRSLVWVKRFSPSLVGVQDGWWELLHNSIYFLRSQYTGCAFFVKRLELKTIFRKRILGKRTIIKIKVLYFNSFHISCFIWLHSCAEKKITFQYPLCVWGMKSNSESIKPLELLIS